MNKLKLKTSKIHILLSIGNQLRDSLTQALCIRVPLQLQYINKSNQYRSNQVCPFMHMRSRYPCTTDALVHTSIFASVYVAIENAYALVTHHYCMPEMM